MAESFAATVTSKPSTYADGDQKLTIRLTQGGTSFKKGDLLTVTAGAPVPVPEPPPNQPPSVSVTSPAPGTSVVAGETVALAATASDPDGTIAGVEFFVDNIGVVSDTTAPYAGTWLPPRAGTYVIAAVARDSSGNVVQSSPVALTVNVAPGEPGPSSGPRKLLGGWRIAQDFPRGNIAIDFSRMKLWMAGHAQRHEVLEYDLPAMGTGSDVNAWPRVDPIRTISGWWLAGAYCNGLIWWQNKLWVSPRMFYDQSPSSEESLTIYASDGETINFPNLRRQIFSGFVKTGPGLQPLLGSGGYESGQGTASGPSLATMANGGTPLTHYGWPGDPGPIDPATGVPVNWDLRAPRDTNFSVIADSWLGWAPRTLNGVHQARWASDRVIGGGLVLPSGVTYWPWMAAQGDAYPLDYAIQSYTFALDQDNRTYEYTYTTEGMFVAFAQRPEFGSNPIYGQELGPDGRIYLAHANQWQSGAYITDIAIKVYG